MNRRVIASTLLLWIALAGLTPAQQPGGGASGPPSGLGGDRATSMQEEIEILRQILDRKLASAPGMNVAFCPGSHGHINLNNIDLGRPMGEGRSTGTPQPPIGAGLGPVGPQTGSPDGVGLPAAFPGHEMGLLRGAGAFGAGHWPFARNDSVWGRNRSGLEGHYVKGHGLLFSASLPIDPPVEPAVAAAPPARKPLSEWDRVRRELRGEPVDDGGVLAQPAKPSLSSSLLKALAENGHNLSGLGESETVTVAVTFRPGNTLMAQGMCAACHNVPVGGGPGAGAGVMPPGIGEQGGGAGPAAGAGEGSTGGAPTGFGAPPGSSGGGRPPGPGGAAAGTPEGSDAITETRNFILLGDLHMKQGRAKDAVDAYNRAAKSFDKVSQNAWSWQLNEITTGQELYARLAQAHLALGNVDEARKVLEQSLKIPKMAKGVGATDGNTGAALGLFAKSQPAVPLPARLVITVSKRALDDIAAGKLSFDELKKQATVQRLNYPSPRGAGGGGPATGSNDSGR